MHSAVTAFTVPGILSSDEGEKVVRERGEGFQKEEKVELSKKKDSRILGGDFVMNPFDESVAAQLRWVKVR